MSPKAPVNVPTDPKQKEKDINQKIQLFGMYHAFSKGKLPSNKQCDIALNSALASKALTSPPNDLSSEGRILIQDLRNVIEQAKILLLSKNEGELLQDFIWQAQHINAGEVKGPTAPINKEAGQQDANKTLEGLKTLGTLLITNGEFRKILSDAVTLIRDMAADSAQKAANAVRPPEEMLSKIDEPAEQNTWHEKPNLSKEDIKQRLSKKKNSTEPLDTATTSPNNAAMPATTNTSPNDTTMPANANAQPYSETDANSMTPSEQSLRKKYGQQTRAYLSEKVPKERREQVIWRLKKMIIEIQGHADYQQAIETLLSMAEKYAGHTKNVSSQSGSAVRSVRSNERVQSVEHDLRTLIERFANNTSLADFFDSLDNIYRDADSDPELRGWFSNINTYIRKCLREQGFIMQDEATRQWNELYDKGRYLLRERYRTHTDRIVDESKFMADQFDKDPRNKALADAVQKLFYDLGRDSGGKIVFKKHLLKDIRDVIIPGVIENVRYIPIPRIEVSDPTADVVVENLTIESDNLMPNVIEFGSDNYFRWGRKKISNKRDNKIMIAASGIQADLRDVSYYIKKKEGFPSLTDTGIMDIFLGGEGFGFKIAASTADKKDKEHFVKLDSVSVNIKNMDIKLKKSKHKLLFAAFKPLLFRVVRPALEKVLEAQIRKAFTDADAYARNIHDEARRAQEAAREDPENAPTIFSRYADAMRSRAQSKADQAKAVADRASRTKVQTVMTLHDSMFPDIKLPGGISNKTTEYVELAGKGEKWESPIFSIGNAAESRDIPSAGPVTRKPHTTAADRVGNAAHGTTLAGTSDHYTNGNTAVNGNAALDSTGALGGVNGHSKVDGYPAHGFSDEVDQAFINGKTTGLGGNRAPNTMMGTNQPGLAINTQTVPQPATAF
ncbi:hypothetical protein N7539_001225 [Penicillium diatomitis]|uniref:Uncharacterized protein n=1 Tax=Penicillium diatomitis TaxID=2819901 RepID=A0A9W9XN96_9EURO|nr:uncharacterized protein N7539_001225 [Penicillium diatomitis]KAJ5496109.1 hypothetical protein N7539_001225 [Penicillium diatomitis]